MPELQWAYGVTTVPSRIENGLLKRTLESLKNGGFPDPRLFVDGPFDISPYHPYSTRSSSLKIYGNFHLGLSELFIRHPEADLFAMFQDDFVAYKNLRAYLEQCEYPAKGYWNLYTFPQNEKDIQGWYQSNQLGKGAVALVFNNEAVQALLTSPYWITRPASNPSNPARKWKFIDGGIVETMKKSGFKEYVHGPSLVQHTGTKSTLGNNRHAQASTFRGEDFDALDLLSKKAPTVLRRKKPRIGMVGFNTLSGLGELNRQIAAHADIYRWHIMPHKRYKMQPMPEDVDCSVCPTGSGQRVRDFVKSVDVVVFAENPLFPNLVDHCLSLKRRMVCVPMMEWMPPGARGWPKEVDLFLCPTKDCFDQLSHVLPCEHFPWPVDTERFQFRQRTKCERFLFINGRGGWQGRKGGDVVREAIIKSGLPNNTFVVISQASSGWPQEADVLPATKSNANLYREGDVLLCPHSVDGLGLEPMEALASGMPVIATDGEPWNELPVLASIQASSQKKSVKRPVTWYTPDSTHLAQLCRAWHTMPIDQSSQEAREWAEQRSWNILAPEFNRLVSDHENTLHR